MGWMTERTGGVDAIKSKFRVQLSAFGEIMIGVVLRTYSSINHETTDFRPLFYIVTPMNNFMFKEAPIDSSVS